MNTRMRLPRRVGLVLAGAALSVALLVVALASRAGAVQAAGFTYYTPTSVCTQELVAFNEPGVGISGGGYVRSAAQSLVYSQGNACYAANLVPPGAIRVNHVLQKLSGASWVYCSGTQTGDYYNTSVDWYRQISTNYGSSPRCGQGAYRAMGRGWVEGRGGALVTPPMTLP